VDENAAKNRPGQRARRLKAERKYGEEAKHVTAGVEGQGAGADADGWYEDPNEGGKWKQTKRIDYPSAPSGLNRKERRKRKEGGASGEAEGGGAGAGGETPPERKKPRKEKAEKSESLHPSWEAKKNAKPLVAAFAGTKVTFD